MLTNDDIFFNEQDEAALIENLNVGDEYRIRGTIIAMYNDEGNIEAARQFSIHEFFMELLQNSASIECMNDDCSIIRFLDNQGNELNQLTTTSELGSMLASNPKIHFGHSIKTKKE